MQQKKWGFWVLTAFVVGNMVGAGIFMVPSTLAQTASPLGVTLAWLTTGFGVLMLALVFGNLAIRRPDLTTGPQSHAYALFSTPKKKKWLVSVWYGDIGLQTGQVTLPSLHHLRDIYHSSSQL